MSNLRDRLKKISAERRQETPQVPAPRPACACRAHWTDAPALDLAAETLALLGGEEFSGLCLRPEDWVFVDTETTGLSGGVGTIAFEIGIGEIMDGRMRVTQLWMRDYDQEEDMLARLGAFFEGKKAVVTFNGKSFDLPLLASRCTLNRIRAPFSGLAHLDLVHPARRLYKLRLKQCSLSHLEETVLDIHRKGDIPGGEIPAIWADFLRTGREDALLRVFDHNLQDVASMALLLRRLYDAHETPETQTHQEDLFSLGRVYDRAGRADVAERCYVSASAGALSGMAGKALARIYRRAQRTEDTIRLLDGMIAAGSGGIFPYVELAKLYEHRLGDPKSALLYTDAALSRTMDPNEIKELTHRRARLASRIKRKA
jgi:uncharacterized protein YprB with RNaseH-like and TPR domain